MNCLLTNRGNTIKKEFTLAFRLVDKLYDEEESFDLTFTTSALGNISGPSVQEQNKNYFKLGPSEYAKIITCGVYVRNNTINKYIVNGSMHIQYYRINEKVIIKHTNLPEGINKLDIVRVDNTTFDFVLS